MPLGNVDKFSGMCANKTYALRGIIILWVLPGYHCSLTWRGELVEIMLHSWGFLQERFLWMLCKAASLLFVKRKICHRIKNVHLKVKQQWTGKENSHFLFAVCFCSSTPFLHTQQSHALFSVLSVNNFLGLIISTCRNFCRDFVESYLSEFLLYGALSLKCWAGVTDTFKINSRYVFLQG